MLPGKSNGFARWKFREALRSQDEATFQEAIINELGQLPGTAEYQQSMKVWRAFRG
jgi:hypothetical protein